MRFPFALALILPLAACARTETVAPRPDSTLVSTKGSAPMPLASASASDTQRAARDANAFGADLYAKLRAQPGNLVFSPASIALAFGMTEAGARGETATELRRAMHVDLPEETLHPALGALAKGWNTRVEGTFELATANRLFGQKGWPFERSFLDLTSSAYDAPLEAVDFAADPEAERAHVNGWVSDRTRAKIQDLLPAGSITGDTRLVLVNAVYLKAKWASPFEHAATRDADFHANGAAAAVKVPTMHQTTSFPFAQKDGYAVLELPYAQAGYALDVVLPDAVDGLAPVEAKWQASSPDAFFTGLASTRVALALPKFKATPPAIKLSPTLKSLGVSLAFDRTKADFTGIAPFKSPDDRLYVSEAFHKAFLALDEEGTEAAAATAVVMMRAAAAIRQDAPRPFVVDRPFLFFVRDTTSGAILFAGRVVDPR